MVRLLQTPWNTCQHGSYSSWSWHRMYLYWFERICRRMPCEECFALPYWDYNSASQRQLPAMFRGSGSGLFVSQRSFKPGTLATFYTVRNRQWQEAIHF